jgi:uncharacterized membrane protein YhaH (DUF805 family)
VRGEILRYDDQAGTGLVSGDDGVRYSFVRAEVQRLAPLAAGMRVDFVNEGTEARAIIPLGAQPDAMPSQPRGSDNIGDKSAWAYFIYCLRKYVDGNGRARRKEYWSFVLFLFVFLLGAVLLDAALQTRPGSFNEYGSPIFILTAMAFTLPQIAVSIRRLHDIGLSGWLMLIGIVPIIGALFMFVCALIPSQDGDNQHGPNPKGINSVGGEIGSTTAEKKITRGALGPGVILLGLCGAFVGAAFTMDDYDLRIGMLVPAILFGVPGFALTLLGIFERVSGRRPRPSPSRTRESFTAGVVLCSLGGGFWGAAFLVDGTNPMLVPAVMLGALGVSYFVLAASDAVGVGSSSQRQP